MRYREIESAFHNEPRQPCSGGRVVDGTSTECGTLWNLDWLPRMVTVGALMPEPQAYVTRAFIGNSGVKNDSSAARILGIRYIQCHFASACG